MKGFESRMQQMTCIECGAGFEDAYSHTCPACVKVKRDWFWALWNQQCRVPCAPGCELIPVVVEGEPLPAHRHCDPRLARCPRYTRDDEPAGEQAPA